MALIYHADCEQGSSDWLALLDRVCAVGVY